MNKRILHLIDSGGFYGAEAVILNLSLGLKERGWIPVVGCFWLKGKPKPALGEIAESLGIDIRYILLRNKLDLFALKQIHKVVQSDHIALIHSHGYKPSAFCVFLRVFYGIPFVVTCHLWFQETFKAKLRILVDKVSMVFAKKIIAVSQPIADDISSWKILKHKVEVINNGIDIGKYSRSTKTFDPLTLRRELGLHENTTVVGTLGRLTFQKAHQYLIEAAEILLKANHNIEFVVAGEGHRREYLVDLVNQKGISDRFHFVGYRSDARNVMRLFDIFVLCSIDEGLPIVLLEAMSLGIPTVSTDVGEIPRVIEDGINGLLIRKGDVDSLAESINKLIENPESALQVGKRGFVMARTRFSMERMTDRYITAYEEVRG